MKRTAVVKDLDVISISSSAVIQVGDCQITQPFTRQIAVQKFAGVTGKEDEQYENHEIFTRKNPTFPAHHHQTIRTINHNKAIKVNRVSLIGLTTSSQVQIGCCDNIHAEARIKHIRII
ncbi:spore germination protein GerPE [Amphibacillus sediminis]|uniref:spore germination protein GerPE n=1 Tax=Amphibacillus sediminis TaxID=360185 RepID=UPI00082FD675|nr:spore germination protein GerPE [Amphibacillus sediminis]